MRLQQTLLALDTSAATSRICFWMRVLVITGAGVSAESGIPIFRGKDGYWRNLYPTKLATSEELGRDPELVWGRDRKCRLTFRIAGPKASLEAIARIYVI